MQLYKHKDKVYSVHEHEVTEWPLSKGMKIANGTSRKLYTVDPHILSWSDVERLLTHIHDKLISTLPLPVLITCPPGRGGLVPAAILAYKLDIHFVSWEKAPDSDWVVCIDDIIDTGATLKKCIDEKPKIRYVGMTSRWHDYNLTTGKVLHTPEYVIFPWDAP